MADYAILHNLTPYGIQIMQSDPSVANNLVIQADAHAKIATQNNYGIGGTYLDLEGGVAWYDLQPLTISAELEMQQASLGMPSAGFLDWIKNIMSYAIPVASGIIAGAVLGGLAGTAIPVVGTAVGAFIGALVGGLSGAYIANQISEYSYQEAEIEFQQNKNDTVKTLTQMLADGDITQEQYDNALAAIMAGMEEENGGIPWTGIIVGGMVGALALGALYIYMKKKK